MTGRQGMKIKTLTIHQDPVTKLITLLKSEESNLGRALVQGEQVFAFYSIGALTEYLGAELDNPEKKNG